MNVNKEKNEDSIYLSLSALIFITLIAGLFLIKKSNKEENSYENNNPGEVVNENDKVFLQKNIILGENKSSIQKTNWFGFATLVSIIVIAFLFLITFLSVLLLIFSVKMRGRNTFVP